MNKIDIVKQFSNPDVVQQKAYKILGKNAKIHISPRKNKKYKILNPNTYKYIHFGEIGYEDATKHNDPIRINKFKNRNRRWKDAEQYTPAYLSYYLLW